MDPKTRPIFALIIGVDKYATKSPNWLHGCVNDSNAVVEYIRELNKGAPEGCIKQLTDAKATRSGILNAFAEHLIQNASIAVDDPILFYFAGHGGRQRTKRTGWMSEQNLVEVICPYDVQTSHGIPDYTIAALLRRLQHVKGKNITVILDSCYSGGMDRDADEGNGVSIRTYDPSLQLPTELDKDIWSWSDDAPGKNTRAEVLKPNDIVRPKDMHDALRSSVLLAACRPHESAREVTVDGTRRGAFTAALIPKMRSDNRCTYHDVIAGLHLEHQNPCCVGAFQHRLLFSTVLDNRFAVFRDGDDYCVTAGWIHGVEVGTTSFQLEMAEIGAFDVEAVLYPETVYAGHCSLKSSTLLGKMAMFPKVTMINRRPTGHLFKFYLNHHPNEDHALPTRLETAQPLVTLEMKKLAVDTLFLVYKPHSDVTFSQLSDSEMPHAEVNCSDIYGFQLENNGPIPLFLYMFYFDPARQSIDLWHSSDFPLLNKSHEPMTPNQNIRWLPHEKGGWLGKRFALERPEQESSFVKIYASSEKVKMTHITSCLSSPERLTAADIEPTQGLRWASFLYEIRSVS